jgi:hypothetical protein
VKNPLESRFGVPVRLERREVGVRFEPFKGFPTQRNHLPSLPVIDQQPLRKRSEPAPNVLCLRHLAITLMLTWYYAVRMAQSWGDRLRRVRCMCPSVLIGKSGEPPSRRCVWLSRACDDSGTIGDSIVDTEFTLMLLRGPIPKP